MQACKDDGSAMQLVHSWLRDKDIRILLTSVVEDSSVAYIKMSHVLSDFTPSSRFQRRDLF